MAMDRDDIERAAALLAPLAQRQTDDLVASLDAVKGVLKMDGIEVGFVDGDLPIVRLKEAVRQGEKRMDGQAASIQAMETRATALLGWCAASSVALLVASANPAYAGLLSSRVAVAAGLAGLMIAAAFCAAALWPQQWLFAGYGREQIDAMKIRTEFELLDGLSGALQRDADINQKRLAWFARLLRLAWVALIAAPVMTAVVLAAAP